MINRDIFYQRYKICFGHLTQEQVDDINFLLDKLDASELFNLAKEYAYILATTKHETADTYKSIKEMGNNHYLKSKPYYPYFGRGFVQLTWIANYTKFAHLLDLDLVKNPDLALDPETAWKIMEYGMFNGSFTGRKMKMYFDDNRSEYYNARAIINPGDRSDVVAGYAIKFESMIEFN